MSHSQPPAARPDDRSGVWLAGAAIAEYVPDLLDAAHGGNGLRETLSGVAGWWRQRLGGRFAIGVAEQFQRRTVAAVIDAAGELRTDVLEECLQRGSAGLRDELLRVLGVDQGGDWTPLGDRGRIIGGLVVVRGNEAAALEVPALWIDVTARLLARAREEDSRLLTAKLESLAEFAAGAGHEINNPLGTILGRAQGLLRDETDPERKRLLSTIGAQALRIKDMIGDAMLFARPPKPKITNVDLARVLPEVLSRFETAIAERRATVERSWPEQILLLADPIQLRVVISELMRNSLEAISDGGQIQLAAAFCPGDSQPCAELTITNNGPPLTALERQHLFDPFFSGRSAGRGLGFGLTKCWRIVQAHGGCIHANSVATGDAGSAIGAGAQFMVHWPMPLTR